MLSTLETDKEALGLRPSILHNQVPETTTFPGFCLIRQVSSRSVTYMTPPLAVLKEWRPPRTRPDQCCEIWWQRRGDTESDVFYAKFSTRDPSPELRVQARMKAVASNSMAVQVSENGTITETNWVDPFGPPFEALENIPKIRRRELTTIRQIKQGVDLVQYNGTEYIHKHMTGDSSPLSFESEINNYQKTLGSPYLATFHAIVTHKDLNRGILLRYVSSKSLDSAQLTPSEKYTVVGLLLTALSDLEAHGYYPQDLKLSNILLSDDKRVLHVVDLGAGVTEGMYRVDSVRRILLDKMNSRDMCYTFGKTVWDLFSLDDSDESPGESPDDLSVENLPDLIQKMVLECCGNEMDPEKRVEDVHREYSELLENAASRE